MERRDLFRALGAASALALLPLPHDVVEAWARVASGLRSTDGLSDAQLALVGAIGDTIIPRTDTPSATDVQVPPFVNVMVAEYYTDGERTAFLAGLSAIDAHATANGGGAFASLGEDARGKVIESIEALAERRAEPARTYWRLKDLVVSGYFTSEPVMKQVLKVQVMPGKFEGAAPMPKRGASPSSGGAHV